jgi:hypothetical protein
MGGSNLTDDDHMTFAVNFGAMVGANFVEERSYGIDFIARCNREAAVGPC